jgi:hypothetical protein
MNVWSLQKETKIKTLLIILQEYLGRDAFVIDMDTIVSWEAIYIMCLSLYLW